MTRRLAREIAHRDWGRRCAELDFPFEMDDLDLAGVPCVVYRGRAFDPDGPIFLYCHAGGFIAGSARLNAAAVLPLCELGGVTGIGVDYSLAPERHFPTALNEIEAVYRALIEQRAPGKVVLIGDSAGANLALASLLRWRDAKLPMPAGAVVYSPTIDASASSDTMQTLKSHDPLVNAHAVARMEQIYRIYAPNTDLRHPHISPIYANLEGLPPLLIMAGTRESLLGEAARLAERAHASGVAATLRIFDGMFHLFHMHWAIPEAREAQKAAAAFIQQQTA